MDASVDAIRAKIVWWDRVEGQCYRSLSQGSLSSSTKGGRFSPSRGIEQLVYSLDLEPLSQKGIYYHPPDLSPGAAKHSA